MDKIECILDPLGFMRPNDLFNWGGQHSVAIRSFELLSQVSKKRLRALESRLSFCVPPWICLRVFEICGNQRPKGASGNALQLECISHDS